MWKALHITGLDSCERGDDHLGHTCTHCVIISHILGGSHIAGDPPLFLKRNHILLQSFDLENCR